MGKKIRKINNVLRVIFLIFGGVIVAFKLFDMSQEDDEADEEDVSSKDFDDVW